MIRSLQKRIVGVVTASFLAVMLLLLVCLNVVTRRNTYADIDTRLQYLADSMLGPPQGMIDLTPEHMRTWIDLNDAGIMNARSYFIFDAYMTVDVREQQIEMLSLALGEDANEIMRSILGGTRDFGNVGQYRFYVAQREDPYKLVFLLCDNEFSSMRTLLNDSILIGTCVFLLVLLLVTLLSRRAMRPFARILDNQKRFISNASHELKTPLGVIVSDLDMQIMESGSSEWLENAQLQADHLSLLIEQLISYALLDEKRQRTPNAPVDLSAVAEALLAEFRPLAASNDQSLAAEIAPGVTVSGNEEAFRMLISVLMENAVKYTPPGGAIRLRLRRAKRAVLEVENTCTNLGEDALDRLFERFYRAPEHRSAHGGSGLGLSIAREITELYGGSIRARRGNDTIIFTAELP